MSTPVTEPAGPTCAAAANASIPEPLPRSSTALARLQPRKAEVGADARERAHGFGGQPVEQIVGVAEGLGDRAADGEVKVAGRFARHVAVHLGDVLRLAVRLADHDGAGHPQRGGRQQPAERRRESEVQQQRPLAAYSTVLDCDAMGCKLSPQKPGHEGAAHGRPKDHPDQRAMQAPRHAADDAAGQRGGPPDQRSRGDGRIGLEPRQRAGLPGRRDAEQHAEGHDGERCGEIGVAEGVSRDEGGGRDEAACGTDARDRGHDGRQAQHSSSARAIDHAQLGDELARHQPRRQRRDSDETQRRVLDDGVGAEAGDAKHVGQGDAQHQGAALPKDGRGQIPDGPHAEAPRIGLHPGWHRRIVLQHRGPLLRQPFEAASRPGGRR